MEIIKNRQYDEERALYERCSLCLEKCSFQGEADGESALKESRDITAKDCLFDLRYPFWHCENVEIINSEMTVKCRAPIWYTRGAMLRGCTINGTKAVRESGDVSLVNCSIVSDELGWDTHSLHIEGTSIEGAYMLSRASDVTAVNMKMKGKYSFQYIENGVFDSCTLDTKDAFWHAKNVTVKNSVINGEYLAWYSENLTFENCVITGTQPFCYCRGLKLINCQMYSCDLAFERSQVCAEITTPVMSIKNVLEGKITVPCVDNIICDSEIYKGEIIIKE